MLTPVQKLLYRQKFPSTMSGPSGVARNKPPKKKKQKFEERVDYDEFGNAIATVLSQNTIIWNNPFYELVPAISSCVQSLKVKEDDLRSETSQSSVSSNDSDRSFTESDGKKLKEEANELRKACLDQRIDGPVPQETKTMMIGILRKILDHRHNFDYKKLQNLYVKLAGLDNRLITSSYTTLVVVE